MINIPNQHKCKLLKPLDCQGVLKTAGTIIDYDKEDDYYFHINIGHGTWITLRKGVEADKELQHG